MRNVLDCLAAALRARWLNRNRWLTTMDSDSHDVLTSATWRVTVPDDTDDPAQGLKRLFEQDDPRGVNPEHIDKLRNILATLHAAPVIAHMDLPGFRLHPLKGELKGLWAVTVRANWRVIFRFDEGAEDVDYVDYH